MRDERRRSDDKRNAGPDALQLLARRERFVVTTAEMRRSGITKDVQARHRRDGVLVRQFRGVFLVGRVRPTRDERERAAVKACGEGAVLSHRSAAARWRILHSYRGPVEVTCRTQRRRQPGLRPHRGALRPQDVTVKDGIPITTIARTLVDLAGCVAEPVLDTAVHEAEILKRLHVPTVEATLARAGARAGAPALLRCLRRYRPVDGRVDRTLERKFLRFLRDRGFPPSRHNVTFRFDGGEEVTLDVYFDDQRVGIELDGGVHLSRRHFHRDRRTSRRVYAAHGVVVLRVTDEDVDERQDELAADLRAALERRS